MSVPAVEVRHLVKEYGRRRVLDVDHLAVSARTVCVLVGPNGSGKTTLLSLMALLEFPTAGSIALFGEDAASQTDGRRLRDRVVMVHERPWMFRRTVLANVVYGLSARGFDRRRTRQRAVAALDAVGMAHALNWPAPNLSAGEARRVALARALAIRPELILLDEPLADVDTVHAAAVERLIRGLPRQGTTVLLATHQPETAHRLADQCVSLFDGRISEVLPDNHFAGVIREDDGEPVMEIAPGCTLRLSTSLRGPAHVMIDPRTIIVSRTPPGSDVRNCFLGRIAGLADLGECIRLTVDVGVPIVALVAEQSFRGMDLRLGEQIAVVFKAVSLRVHGGRSE